MQDSTTGLHRAGKQDIKKVVETLASAFFNDHLLCEFVPDPERRSRFALRFFNYRARNGFLDGQVFATSKNIEGVVFLTRSEYKNTFSWLRAMRTGGFGVYRAAGSETVSKMRQVESFVFSKRAEYITEPHLYLSSLAVHPDHQGKGMASRLVRAMLKMCRSEDKPCVLDTQDEKLVQMYEHLGFEVIGSYDLPMVNVSHWLMVNRL
jgi:ribosomal protein S18 acetylase RimI-like enzyme